MSSLEPLRGLKIVDFSLYVPGSYCTMILADLGAEVIKVEPITGDPVRNFMPGLYEVMNAGKHVLPINLKEPAGLDVCHRVLRDADVVVEGFRPGVADRMGFGYRTVKAIAPSVVYCSLSGYGQDGPRASDPGHDVNYTATAGGFAVQLAVGNSPHSGPLAAADLGGAMFAATSICAALAASPRESVYLDVSLTEAALALSAVGWGSAMTGRPIRASDVGSLAPGYGTFRCADGHWVAVGAVEDRFWHELCVLVDASALAEPPFDSHVQRMLHRDVLAERLAAAVGSVSSVALLADTAALDLPVSTVYTVEDVLADEHLQYREAIRPIEHGFVVDHPVRHDGERPRRHHDHRPLDGLSELSVLTGFDDGIVAELVRSGIVGYSPARAGV